MPLKELDRKSTIEESSLVQKACWDDQLVYFAAHVYYSEATSSKMELVQTIKKYVQKNRGARCGRLY